MPRFYAAPRDEVGDAAQVRLGVPGV